MILKILISLLQLPTGGETIKGISQQSGARIELQRNPPPNADPNIKMFTVRGSHQQIDYARQLVEEKIGVRPLVVLVLMNEWVVASHVTPDLFELRPMTVGVC